MSSIFYADSSASNPAGTTAVLLPILSSAVDTNSLANLQATYFQRLQYQQAQDPSVSASSYTATVDFGFQVPSVVFDHSSQIYIISQSGTSIVFGFGSTDAFAQASAWPQSGIALLVQGQCESDEAHDVYMLNGFIYNGSNLTVAANYSTGQVSNMTSSMNVTFGRYSASDGAGNPKNYTSDVRYVDASFFSSSSSILNNAYYANLNGTNDTILDDEHGVYYTSLTQALLYDLADPQDYDNPSAYELLTEQTIEENEAELKNTYLDPSDIQNATSPDFDNPIDNSTDVSEVFDAEDESLTNRDLRDHPDPDLNPDPDPDPVGIGIPNRVSPGSGSGRVQSLRDGIGTGLKFWKRDPVFSALDALFFCFFKKNMFRKWFSQIILNRMEERMIPRDNFLLAS